MKIRLSRILLNLIHVDIREDDTPNVLDAFSTE